ncbi:MAG: HAD family hydrolase [Anaerolineales bacterium]|jgi:sugar-phosphatase
MTADPSSLTCAALLFDLDGVLIDSTGNIIRHWQTWADEHGFDVQEIMRTAHGMRTVETIRRIAPHLDAEAESARIEALEVSDTDGVVAMPGARELLESLPAGKWTIVTSGTTALARARLRRAKLPIPQVLVTADDVQNGKPAPDPYLLGAQRLGIAPTQAVVLEDAEAGIQAGRAANMRVIGIAGTHPPENLLAHGATVVVGGVSQLRVSDAAGQLVVYY